MCGRSVCASQTRAHRRQSPLAPCSKRRKNRTAVRPTLALAQRSLEGADTLYSKVYQHEHRPPAGTRPGGPYVHACQHAQRRSFLRLASGDGAVQTRHSGLSPCLSPDLFCSSLAASWDVAVLAQHLFLRIICHLLFCARLLCCPFSFCNLDFC